MNEQQLVAVKQALETLQDFADDIRHDNEQDEIGCRSCCGVLSYDNHSENCKAMKSIAALQSIISQDALDKMAENARELGLDYEPAPVQELLGYIATMAANDLRASIYGDVTVYGEDLEDTVAIYTTPPAAQPAVQEGRDWSLLEATQESLREHMAEIKRLKAAQPAPVQEPVAWVNHGENRITRATGWDGYGALYTTPPAAQKTWVGLTDEERNECTQSPFTADQHRAIEAKLKGKNHE
jgi:hypothetical protein